MPTLYITEPGARLEKEYRRLLVSLDDQVLLAVPAARVDHIVLVGRVGVTTPALHSLLDEGVGLSLLNPWGKLEGRLLPAGGGNLALRHRQYEHSRQPAFCLAVGKAIVAGKLRGERNLARRMARSRPQIEERLLERISAALLDVERAASLAELRGLEGRGARSYFAVLRASLPDNLGFARRARRPPPDPVNGLLSLGYTLLTENLMSACEVVGLDPYDGFLHSDKYNRPALALDLMEEFRAPIVDSVVLNLLNRRRLDKDDFQPGPGGAVYLTQKGLGIFFRQYSARIQTEVIHPLAGRALSYQKIFEVQARQLRKVIEGEAEEYVPFVPR